MKLSPALVAIVLGHAVFVAGAASLATGCAEEASELDGQGDLDSSDPGLGQLGGPIGSTGTNNLPPPPFHSNRNTLLGSTQSTFGSSVSGTWYVANNASNNTLLSTTDSQKVIKYSMRCATDAAITVHAQLGSSLLDFPGQGLLTTTTDWLNAPLPNAAAQDLFGCLLAHLNARNIEVPINLSGPSVTNTAGSDSGFTWQEALWVAKITPGGSKSTFSFNVWPLEDLVTCAEYVAQLTNRVCGTYSGNCGLTVRGDRATACVEQANGWYCDVGGTSLPAIKTRLKVTDVELLYDTCP